MHIFASDNSPHKLYNNMKKTSYLVAALLMACSAPCLTSCFVGSFSCVNSMWEWNSNLTGNSMVNAVIGFILGPFETSIGGFLDTVIFNSIEFWTGSNPIASTQVVKASDGNYYAVASDKNGGYTITCQATGQQMQYLFDKENHTWTAAFNGTEVKLFSMVDEQNAIAYIGGQELAFSFDEQGLQSLQEAYDNSLVALN